MYTLNGEEKSSGEEEEREEGLIRNTQLSIGIEEGEPGRGKEERRGERGERSYEDRGADREEDEESKTFMTSILRTKGITVSIESEPIRPEKNNSTSRGE